MPRPRPKRRGTSESTGNRGQVRDALALCVLSGLIYPLAAEKKRQKSLIAHLKQHRGFATRR